jgi:hypothetical protein
MFIIPTEALFPFLYAGFAILVLGSIYLIVEAVRVHRLFAESIIGKLVKTLVIVVVIELYSLGVVTYAFLNFFERGIYILLPIIGLWILCVIYSAYAVRSARTDVGSLIHK